MDFSLILKPELLQINRLNLNSIQEKHPRELVKYVSQFIGYCNDQALFFTKTIILKAAANTGAKTKRLR